MRRVLAAVLLLAMLPIAVELPALATLLIATSILCAMITYEVIRYSDARERIRHGLVDSPGIQG